MSGAEPTGEIDEHSPQPRRHTRGAFIRHHRRRDRRLVFGAAGAASYLGCCPGNRPRLPPRREHRPPPAVPPAPPPRRRATLPLRRRRGSGTDAGPDVAAPARSGARAGPPARERPRQPGTAGRPSRVAKPAPATPTMRPTPVLLARRSSSRRAARTRARPEGCRLRQVSENIRSEEGEGSAPVRFSSASSAACSHQVAAAAARMPPPLPELSARPPGNEIEKNKNADHGVAGPRAPRGRHNKVCATTEPSWRVATRTASTTEGSSARRGLKSSAPPTVEAQASPVTRTLVECAGPRDPDLHRHDTSSHRPCGAIDGTWVAPAPTNPAGAPMMRLHPGARHRPVAELE